MYIYMYTCMYTYAQYILYVSQACTCTIHVKNTLAPPTASASERKEICISDCIAVVLVLHKVHVGVCVCVCVCVCKYM